MHQQLARILDGTLTPMHSHFAAGLSLPALKNGAGQHSEDFLGCSGSASLPGSSSLQHMWVIRGNRDKDLMRRHIKDKRIHRTPTRHSLTPQPHEKRGLCIPIQSQRHINKTLRVSNASSPCTPAPTYIYYALAACCYLC